MSQPQKTQLVEPDWKKVDWAAFDDFMTSGKRCDYGSIEPTRKIELPIDIEAKGVKSKRKTRPQQ